MFLRYFVKRKNALAFISGVLIVGAFICHLLLKMDFYGELLFSLAAIIAALPIAIGAYQSLRVKVISIDVLVTIAVIGAFLIKNYEEAAIVSFLFLIGNYLEARTLNKTRLAIKELVMMMPETALVKQNNNQFIEVPLEDVEIDNIILVKTGARIGVDGIITSGYGYLNESAISGESLPLYKEEKDFVSAGTILENGTIEVKATAIGEATTFGKIIELVEEAQESKSQTERFIDSFSRYYTPAVLVLALLVLLITFNVELTITVLVLGCPGALVIGVPISNVAGIGNGARNGVLLKGSEVIRDLSKTDVVVFDKTGTLTTGKPVVAETIFQDEEDLSYLISVEKESDHPLALAILDYHSNTTSYPVTNTHIYQGSGIKATVNKKEVIVGNRALLKQQNVLINDKQLKQIIALENDGNSIVLTAINNQLRIIVAIKDQLRLNANKDLQTLRKLGVKELIMLSGDNQGTVDSINKQLKLDQAIGNMLPTHKNEFVQDLKAKGHIVTFVGDGINDSPSLASAHIGIAMGSGTDIAIETSDVVLVKSDLKHLAYALGLAKAISYNMLENIIIALGVVVILLWGLFFNDWVTMSLGMLIHEGSILVVILNGMRLLRYKLK